MSHPCARSQSEAYAKAACSSPLTLGMEMSLRATACVVEGKWEDGEMGGVREGVRKKRVWRRV